MPWTSVMSKFKHGTLHSGGHGPIVRDRKRAIAIMLSEKKKAAEGDEEYQPAGKEKLKRALRGGG